MSSRGGAPTHSAWYGTGQSRATARFEGSVSSGSSRVVRRRSCSQGMRPTCATTPSVPAGWRTTAAPMRYGTLFRRMRSVASTGGVIATTLSDGALAGSGAITGSRIANSSVSSRRGPCPALLF